MMWWWWSWWWWWWWWWWWCTEIDSLWVSCCELESRLSSRRAELERMTVVHAEDRDKMSRHHHQVHSADTLKTSSQQADELRHRLNQLHRESTSTLPLNSRSTPLNDTRCIIWPLWNEPYSLCCLLMKVCHKIGRSCPTDVGCWGRLYLSRVLLLLS